MTRWADRNVDEERVHQEHLATVHVRAHWAYLIGVLAGGTVIMLLFIAWLGSTAG
jgi:hypothetical protein